MKRTLYDYLKEYSDSEMYPFHMPGHKRNPHSGPLSEFYSLDITEIDGFDNLHQPESIIKDAQERAASLYQSEETFYLVNGSTSGILSAISAVAGADKRLIIARNCHKAVYHAAFLNRMRLHYVYPEIYEEYDIAGEVKAVQIDREIKSILRDETIEAADANKKIAGVVITSPTYDGIVSDVVEIADVVHHYGIPLIVDQAHGAHFGFHPAYPENAVRQGADIVIHSVHKTLPAPTQTALLHRNGNLIDREMLTKYLRIYQSSSPSYLLMAGIDEAMQFVTESGFQRLDELLNLRLKIEEKAKNFCHIRVCPLTEPGKLIISVKNTSLTGKVLHEVLRKKYHLQMEMAAGSYVIAILSMMDTEKGINRLLTALQEIDQSLSDMPAKQIVSPMLNIRPEKSMELCDAYHLAYERINAKDAKNRIVAEFVNLYPPGIPILVPGEVISKQILDLMEDYQKNGYTVQGIEHQELKVINI